MTENLDVPVENTGDVAANVANEIPNQDVAPVETAPEAPAEKMIPQSQVSKIAAREAREAAEKARAELLAEIERQRNESAPPAQSLGGMQQMTPEQLRQAIRQEATLMARHAQAAQIESDFKAKIAAEKMADPDFADLYEAMNIEAHPNLIIWANSMDNTAQIIKDLANNPAKYSHILNLVNSHAPKLAEMELQKLSKSIKANIEAQKQPKAPEPLSQIKPSNIGAGDGSFEVSDFRSQPWLRG